MSADDYRASTALNASICKVLLEESPAHAKYYAEHYSEPTEAMERGTIAHALLLEGIDRMDVLPFPDWRTKLAREARNASRANNNIPVLEKHVQPIQDMVGAARHAWDISPDLEGYRHGDGVIEQSIAWDENGLPCKARPDYWSHDHRVMLDPKFTDTSVSPERVARQIIGMAYDQRAAFYIRGGTKLTGIAPKYVFLFVETSPPYGTAFVGISPAMLELGMAKADYAIGKWRECLESGKFPGYDLHIHYAEPRPYDLEQWSIEA